VLQEHVVDQRANGRYPIALEMQYKLLRGDRVIQVGSGKTLNISSGGVLFETDKLLPPTGLVELAIQWPFLLRKVCGLKLVMRGRIVRRDYHTKATAVRAQSHEFRTAGVRAALTEGARTTPATAPAKVMAASSLSLGV
jgi:PilZ domain